jgi:putative transposase
METFSIAKGFHFLAKRDFPELTDKELNRLRAVVLYRGIGDEELVCRTFGMSRASLYRWVKRFDPRDPSSIKERSRRPGRMRKADWPHDLVIAVRDFRRRYPRWGKDKLIVLVRQAGFRTSESTVGRILSYLKRRGEIVEPRRKRISAHRRVRRSYAVRKPRDYEIKQPGDLVQVDTLDIRPVPGKILKQFTARDLISKWDVIEAHERATARTATEFIGTLRRRMPFPIKALQIDGGAEFFAEFEEHCKEINIKLFVLPPKSPKLNGSVERANRTHTEEFYEVANCPWTVSELNPQLIRWEYTYNCIRPHYALGHKSPLQFLQDHDIMVDIKPLYQSHMY